MKKHIFNGTTEIINALVEGQISYTEAKEEIMKFSKEALAFLILNPYLPEKKMDTHAPKHLGIRLSFNVANDVYCKPNDGEKIYISKNNDEKVIVTFVDKNGEKNEWIKDPKNVSMTTEEYINEFNTKLKSL